LKAQRTSWVVDNIPPASVWRYHATASGELLQERSA
jgi:phospholipid N-methyltransferase